MIVTVGTISEGSLQPRDVIPALLDYLRGMSADGERAAGMLQGEWAAIADAFSERSDRWPTPDQKEMAYALWDELYGAIQTRLPAGYVVGSHEGDGANIGVWRD